MPGRRGAVTNAGELACGEADSAAAGIAIPSAGVGQARHGVASNARVCAVADDGVAGEKAEDEGG